ncbi:Golgin subfamily A member 7/ERF4 family-domain-containing protein [Flagelloscypha sp. PMI_526]|nr:Golgin subfamily A member 7/ERF4 family-domain-containing protein [Flagelloscypha sp. PMI_526]
MTSSTATDADVHISTEARPSSFMKTTENELAHGAEDNDPPSSPNPPEGQGVTETVSEAAPESKPEQEVEVETPSFARNSSPPDSIAGDPLTIDTAAANSLDPLAAQKSPPLSSPLSPRRPSSPQPWDLVEPPPDNNQRDPNNYYSVVGSKIIARPRIPKSSYYVGPPGPASAYGSVPVGRIGIHHPREIFRVERDYSGGELIQFAAIYPLELEGRITPTQFIESINSINEILISAHSSSHALFDNMLQILSLQLSRIVWSSHYEKEMDRLKSLFDDLNRGLFHPAGLHIVWPRKVAFLFLEIEYY